jgi:hypothetical protein
VTARFFLFPTFICLLSHDASANVLGPFPIGVDSKAMAMDSALSQGDIGSLIYNPSFVMTAPSGPSAEFGLGRLSYSYEHPEFDPVRLSLFAPIVSAAWVTSSESAIRFGLGIAPTSFSDLEINGLPRRISGTPESLDVKTRRRQIHVPLSLAYQTSLLPVPHSFGFSLLTTHDERRLAATSYSDGVKLVDMNARGTFFRPVIGLQAAHHGGSLGLSYISALTKKFQGVTQLASEPTTPLSQEQVDYEPAVLLTSYRQKIDQFSFTANVNRVFGAGGRKVIRDGVNRKALEADVRDANQLGMQASWFASEETTWSFAYAYLPTIWGAGSYSVDSDGFTHHELGHVFGQFQAIPVRNMSIAVRSYPQNCDCPFAWNTVLFRSAGTQTIDVTGDNPGHYEFEFVSISTGLSARF